MSSNTKKTSVLILTSSFPRWPNDTDPPFVFQLAEKLSDAFDVTILAPHCHGALRLETMGHLKVVRFKYFLEKYQKLAYQGGILSNLKRNRLLYCQIPFFLIFELIALIRLIYLIKPQIVHAHWLIPQGLIAVIGCHLVRNAPKLICTAHGADVYGLRDPISKWLKRYVIRNIDIVTAVSSAMKNDIVREFGNGAGLRLKVIPMGVDLKSRFTIDHTRRNVHQLLFVGRLVAKKGLPYLLEAMPWICHQYPDATLFIIGDGQERPQFENAIRLAGLDKSVRFVGALPNHQLPEYYRMSDLLVFPSVVAKDGDREGLGLVPIEAMGCGCGIIATDLEAVQDIIQPGINGCIVPQRSAKAIADAVVYLFNNRSILNIMRQRGRLSVLEKFDWNVIARNYQNAYLSLIEQQIR